MRREQVFCDVCKVEETKTNKIDRKNIQVIRTDTDKWEEVSYLRMSSIDICDKCMRKILGGDCLFASKEAEDIKFWFKT